MKQIVLTCDMCGREMKRFDYDNVDPAYEMTHTFIFPKVEGEWIRGNRMNVCDHCQKSVDEYIEKNRKKFWLRLIEYAEK